MIRDIPHDPQRSLGPRFGLLKLRLASILVGVTLAAAAGSAQARSSEEWKWGVNPYDLRLHSIPDDTSAVAADICAPTLMYMAYLMRNDATKAATHGTLLTFYRAWREEAAKKHQLDDAAYFEKYLSPNLTMIRNLAPEHLTFWAQHCIGVTQRLVVARPEK